jgi:long-chain acyl-CoA synthetase
LRTELGKAGINAPNSDDDLCNDSAVKQWLLAHLAKNNMIAPKWKRYEVARNIILDPVEWSVDNDMMTPSLKVKLRNLLAHHEGAIKEI